jgi:hypothetical protein
VAGANKPDGKSNTQRVSFTRRDADRIGRVVRTVEAGDKKGNALTFGHRQQPGQGVVGDIFRTARFTGSWSVDSTATVEFTNSTFTPQTATAINLFCGIAGGDVGVAKDIENVWHLISWEMQEVCTTTDHRHRVGPEYTANCEIYRTLVTATQKFLRLTYPFRDMLHGNNARMIYGTMRLLRLYYRRRLLHQRVLLQLLWFAVCWPIRHRTRMFAGSSINRLSWRRTRANLLLPCR